MKRILLFAVLTILFCAGSVFADARAEFGEDRARAIEAIASTIYPGAQVEWTNGMALVSGDGDRQPMRVTDMELRQDPDGGYTCFAPIEFPEIDAQVEVPLETFQPRTLASRNELVAAKLNAQFGVVAVQRGTLQESAATTRVFRVNFTLETADDSWPAAYVDYEAIYGTADFVGQVSWTAKITTNPLLVAGRLPKDLARMDRNKSFRADRAVIDVVDVNTLSIASESSAQVVTTCTVPCLPNGNVLLALWWTTAVAQNTP